MIIKLAKSEIIHFIGIGGIGMSGLALVMKRMGFKVQGSDINLNKNIERLKKNKIKVFIGHEKKNILNATIIVISSAVKKNNIELVAGLEKNLPIYKRGDMLGHITSLTKNIVVVGSHGKTTTTSLVASILSSGNLDPTIINGGVLKSSNNSARLGRSNWSIVNWRYIKCIPRNNFRFNITSRRNDILRKYIKRWGCVSFYRFISFKKYIKCIRSINIK